MTKVVTDSAILLVNTKSEAQIAHEKRNAERHSEAVARRGERIARHNERNATRHTIAVEAKLNRIAEHNARNAERHAEAEAKKTALVEA